MAVANPSNKEGNLLNNIQLRPVSLHLYSKYIASSGLDDYINLWNINNPKRNLTLDGHTKKISCVAFSPN